MDAFQAAYKAEPTMWQCSQGTCDQNKVLCTCTHDVVMDHACESSHKATSRSPRAM